MMLSISYECNKGRVKIYQVPRYTGWSKKKRTLILPSFWYKIFVIFVSEGKLVDEQVKPEKSPPLGLQIIDRYKNGCIMLNLSYVNVLMYLTPLDFGSLWFWYGSGRKLKGSNNTFYHIKIEKSDDGTHKFHFEILQKTIKKFLHYRTPNRSIPG